MSRFDWSGLMSKVEVVGDLHPVRDCDWDALAERLRLPALPPSYIEYARVFGPGYWESYLIVAVPGEWQNKSNLELWATDYRLILQDRLKPPSSADYPGFADDLVRSIVESYDDDFPPRLRNVLRRLVAVGDVDERAWLCLDPDTTDSRGEMKLCLVPVQLNRVVYCAGNLLEFLEMQWLGGKIDETYGLEEGASFEPKPVFRAADAEGHVE